jgi:hypothetical protein
VKQLFERITDRQFDDAMLRSSRHEDIEQVFSYLEESPEDAVRIPCGRSPESKRHILLEYARRRKVKLQTLVPRDGWIYIRLWREGESRKGPRKFQLATPREWVQAKGKTA